MPMKWKSTTRKMSYHMALKGWGSDEGEALRRDREQDRTF